jgi:hypothetical protein
VDVALEGVDAGAVELAFFDLALAAFAEVEDVGTGWFAGAVAGFCSDVVEGGVAVDDFEGGADLDGDDMGDVAAAELFDFDFGLSRWRDGYCLRLGINDPDDDVGEFAFGADFPVFGVADGTVPATADGGDEGAVLTGGFAGEGDGAGDLGVQRKKEKGEKD